MFFCQGLNTRTALFKLIVQEDIPTCFSKGICKHFDIFFVTTANCKIVYLGFQWTDICQPELKLKH